MSVYLDWNASAPLLDEARDAWLEAQRHAWGNPASIHVHGQDARAALDQAKARIAALIGCRAHEIVLTSGGTEANATAIHSALLGSTDHAAHAVVSAIEHSSILRAVPAARQIAVDAEARVHAAALAAACTPATRLICLQFANNETGTLQPIAELVAAARSSAPAAWIHLDACQGALKEAIDLHALGVDSASIAGHKLGAPKGIGVLFVRAGRMLTPLLRGGRQQQDRRSGSEDAAMACALAAACSVHAAQREAQRHRQRELLQQCFSSISAACTDVVWLAFHAPRLANTMLIARPDVDAETLVQRMDLSGFSVSRGSACMAGRGEASHVVRAMGVDPRLAMGAIRISIGARTTAQELSDFAAAYIRESSAQREQSSAADVGTR